MIQLNFAVFFYRLPIKRMWNVDQSIRSHLHSMTSRPSMISQYIVKYVSMTTNSNYTFLLIWTGWVVETHISLYLVSICGYVICGSYSIMD